MTPALRCFLAAVAASVVAMAAPRESEARARGWLQAWDSQGVHRTATAGDEAGATWLEREAAAIAGPLVKSEVFDFERIDTLEAYLEFEGERIVGEVFRDGPSTPDGGVKGRAGEPTAGTPIAVLPLMPTAVYGAEFAQMRRESRHAAHVIITMGGSPGLALLNAEWYRRPFGPPTLQVASGERDRIFAAMERKAEFRVVLRTKRVRTQARNVVLTIPGRDRSRPPIVVMTPRSSWWQSTSERGGGIVCWLETLRAIKANPPGCDVVFTANTGHELGHIGLDEFVARRPGSEKAATWIHYGANIGAVGSKLMLMSPQDDIRTLVTDHLTAAGQKPDLFAEKTLVPIGETKDIHKAGGRYLTLVGPPNTSPRFHLPQDRWPDSVDVPAVARVAEGIAQAIVALSR